MEGEEEEEVAMVGSTLGEYRNNKCPLSGIDIIDLEDPVWDQMKVIYERSAIENYIKNKVSGGVEGASGARWAERRAADEHAPVKKCRI
jgi:hypothetical protein